MDIKLLEILVCPICKGKLIFHHKSSELVCAFDRLAYPIKNDIPVMLESSARLLTVEDLDQIKKGK